MAGKPGPSSGINRGRGILGIERQIKNQEEKVDRNISEAFLDLKKLMEKAGEMSSTAKSIAGRMKDKSKDKSISDDETILFKSHLLSMGVGEDIEDPVTRKTSANESVYFRDLGRQVASFVKPLLKDRGGGQIPLTDLYCMVNRARGMQLISTEDLLNACLTLDQQRLGVSLVTFPSGLMVVQSDDYNNEEMDNEVATIVQSVYEVKSTGITAQELAVDSGIVPSLAKQRLLSAEDRGLVCRDESLQGLLFWPNLFNRIQEKSQ